MKAVLPHFAKIISTVICALAIPIPVLRGQPPLNPREEVWVTDGVVQSTIEASGILYFGGNFARTGPLTGSGLPLDAGTGQASANFPKITGTVRTAISDGEGGWFVGGEFSAIGEHAVMNLAHVRADNTVDASWLPQVTGAAEMSVRVLAVSGSTLFVGGLFDSVANQPRTNLAALDTRSGQVLSWSANADGAVQAFTIAGNTLYAGGNFSQINGQPRARLAAFNVANGQLVANWTPTANSNVWALAVAGTNVYVGGQFTLVNSAPRSLVAALDAGTGALLDWKTTINSFRSEAGVYAIAVGRTNVFLGGNFFGGGPQLFSLASLDTATGRLNNNFRPTANGDFNFNGFSVRALVLDGDTLFVGGDFTRINRQPRNRLVAVNATNGAATAWDPNANGAVFTLAKAGNKIFAGGEFQSVGGLGRTNLAAFDTTTGRATAWNPGANTNVLALAIAGRTIFVGGNFARIGGASRNHIAALDATTGSALPDWNPDLDGSVSALVLAGNTLIAGGSFTQVGSLARERLVALDVSTGAPTTWNPSVSGQSLTSRVSALAVAGNTLYLGGNFSSVNGQARNNAAAFDLVTGQLTSWNPNFDGAVASLAVKGSTVYVGGDFTRAGVQTRRNFAAISATSGKPLLWTPDPDGAVDAMTLVGETLYVGGNFLSIAGQPRGGLALLDLAAGVPLPWNPTINGDVETSVLTLAVASGAIFAGGDFTGVNGRGRPSLAVFGAPGQGNGQVNFVSASLQRQVDGKLQFRVQGNGGTRLTIQSSSNLLQWTELSSSTVPATSFQIDVTDGSAVGVSQRYYRAVLEP